MCITGLIFLFNVLFPLLSDLLWYFRTALGSERVDAHVSSAAELERAVQAQWLAIDQLNFGSATSDVATGSVATDAKLKARRRKLVAESSVRSHYMACGAHRDAEAAESALAAASGAENVDHLYKSATTDSYCYLVYATVSEISSLARENPSILR